MASNEHKKTKGLAFVLIYLVAVLILALLLRFEPLKEIESKTWDWRLRAIAAKGKPDPNIKLIMIDQTSLEFMERYQKISWPWPRPLYNPILLFLKEAGAKAIAFDMLFTETTGYPEDDESFADTVGNSLPTVIPFTLLTSGEERAFEPSAGDSEEDQRRKEQDRRRRELFKQRQYTGTPFEEKFLKGLNLPKLKHIALPMEPLLRKSPSFGNVFATADADKVFRRIAPGMYFNEIPVLGLPFALFHLTHPTSDIPAGLKQKADAHGRYLVRFHGGAETYPGYSAHAIIQSYVSITENKPPKVPLSEFKDAYVFLGTNAPALLDLRPVPFDGNFPGVELNATIFDNILHDDFLRHVPFSLSLLFGAVALIIVTYVSMFAVRWQIPILILLYGGWIVVCFRIGYLGWWLPMAYPLVAMIIATVGALVFQYQFEGRQHRFIKNAFQYYVTPEVIDKIVADPSRLSLGGERRELTILFSDIAGFTTLSEKMEPAKLVQFLNKFLSEMTDIVLRSGGTIDKYEGDAIIAFWNAPLSVPDHRRKGVEAALACQKRLHDLAEYFEREFGVQVRMRVGLNTGFVTVGNFGSSTRFNYTMIGDAANLASRLEGANKVFGSRVLASEATRQGAHEGIPWRKLGDITVVGKAALVTVYEPLDSVLQSGIVSQLGKYEQAMVAFEAGDLDSAEKLFRDIDGDPASAVYLMRIARERESGFTSHVWNLKEK